jgi:hypothetical protein
MIPTTDMFNTGFIVLVVCAIITTLFVMTISSRVTEIWKTLLEWREHEEEKDTQGLRKISSDTSNINQDSNNYN